MHQPVLLDEVIQALAPQPGAIVLDATVGCGGHAERILEAVGASGCLIGLDRDGEALEFCKERLKGFKDQVKLIHGDFGQLASLLDELHVGLLDAALFDLGVSSLQLKAAHRGFSFMLEGPLDMRMDQTQRLTARDLVNRASPRELIRFLRDYGQERWAGRVARRILEHRPLKTTTELAQIVRRTLPPKARWGRIDPATRTFQAIRIAVNRELELLPKGLLQAIHRLKMGGRIGVLAYHSLETRIVKAVFRDEAREGYCEVLTRKPIRPSDEEVNRNPSARSACLRVARRL